MPTYDYVCRACGHAFEHFQSMSDARLKTCRKCKKKKLVRLVGAGAGLIFKGSGFYQTDYKAPAEAASSAKAEKEKGASPKPSEPSAGSSAADAKPAPSSEGKKAEGTSPPSPPSS